MDKNFLDLLSVIDTCLDEAEGGTHCAFYTLIIRIDSLERIYELKPKLVAELISMEKFLRAEDWTISTCAMAFRFDDTITFVEERLGMKEHRDFFILYGTTLDYCVEYGIKEEQFGEKFVELFSKTSKYFDFIKVLRGNIVIRLKEDLGENDLSIKYS